MLPWTLGLLIKKGILSHWSMKFFRFSPLPPYFDTMLKSKKRKYWIWKKHNIECYKEEVRERTQELTWFGLTVYVYMRMSKWLPLSSPKKKKKWLPLWCTQLFIQLRGCSRRGSRNLFARLFPLTPILSSTLMVVPLATKGWLA